MIDESHHRIAPLRRKVAAEAQTQHFYWLIDVIDDELNARVRCN